LLLKRIEKGEREEGGRGKKCFRFLPCLEGEKENMKGGGGKGKEGGSKAAAPGSLEGREREGKKKEGVVTTFLSNFLSDRLNLIQEA